MSPEKTPQKNASAMKRHSPILPIKKRVSSRVRGLCDISMGYNLGVRQFLEESKSGNIDYLDFSQKLLDEAKRLNEKFSFFQCIADIAKRLDIKPGLYGLPISVKDSICVKGLQSSAGSRILAGYVP